MNPLNWNPLYVVVLVILGLSSMASTSQAYLVTLDEPAYFMNAEDNCGLAYDPNLGEEWSSVGLVWEDDFVQIQPMISGLRIPGEDNFTQIDLEAEDNRGNRQLTIYSYFEEGSENFDSMSFAWIQVKAGWLSLSFRDKTLLACQKAVLVSEEEFKAHFEQLAETDFFPSSAVVEEQ